MDIFKFQFTNNPLYKQYCQLVNKDPDHVKSINDIPFLPIEFFKSFKVQTGSWTEEIEFMSSGTTGQTRSRHLVHSIDWYHKISSRCFESCYGEPSGFCWLGLLPSYMEREGASLIFMVDHFIKNSKYKQSGFFLQDHDRLLEVLNSLEKKKIPTILIGVSFALLDFAEDHSILLEHTIVMETGGMKGRREEMTRDTLHKTIQEGIHINKIHSEYGMTELLSQCYSKGEGVFDTSPTMKIIISDLTDPLTKIGLGQRGTINVIDLANVDTCSFIATQDIGIQYSPNKFSVLGRLDKSEIRGCNLLISDL
jgi:phenylacetate-coenzyme A ligase PaaK-like adenylate-forming protein